MTFLKVRKEKICDKKEKNRKRREKLKRKTLMHFSPRISEEIYINYILPKDQEGKDRRRRFRQSVSALVVACLAVVTLIKDCYKI